LLRIILARSFVCQNNIDHRLNMRSIIEHLFPRHCLLCQDRTCDGALCQPCRNDLPWLPPTCCPVCALPTPSGEVCGHCLKEPPAFVRTQALFTYAFPADRLIQHLKYHEHLAIAPLLGQLMARHASVRPDVWLPMPLHPRRTMERGFNQAVEIAHELSRQTGIPMRADLAVRTRDTPPQAGLKREARRRNMKGAFSCKPEVSGLHIGIVDDVMTTGSTLNALADSLRLAGAREVSCAVVARA
jgi:ComF family protein